MSRFNDQMIHLLLPFYFEEAKLVASALPDRTDPGGSANQVETSEDNSGTTDYTFDDDGNQQIVASPSGERRTYTWDFENQPTLVELLDGSRVTMAHDAQNRRVRKEI